MIISASRRTDIPAFYAKWLMNRVRAGYCTVPNPFNAQQVIRVSLRPQEVDAVVFWTRNPRPLFPYLTELDERGYRYIFNLTVLNNPRQLDANCPSVRISVRTFRQLSERIGPERVIWRYDPIVLSNLTGDLFHRQTFEQIAEALQGYTQRCIISLVHVYRKCFRRLRDLAAQGLELRDWSSRQIVALMQYLADTASRHGIEIFSCAQEIDFSDYGIKPGKCIDADYLAQIFSVKLPSKKDPAQRNNCGCSISKDIGMYDSCLFDCRYCYATSSHQRALINYRRHNPNSPSLLGWHCPQGDSPQANQKAEGRDQGSEISSFPRFCVGTDLQDASASCGSGLAGNTGSERGKRGH